MKPPAYLLSSVTFATALSLAPALYAQEAERTGGRVGLSLNAGFASLNDGNGASTTAGLVGPTLRFGGALTDRFHLLGEFHLLILPGATVLGYGSATAFHAALGLAGQGYIGPRFFIRAGVGAGWASAVSNGRWVLPIPGPRVSGAIGYDVWRKGETSLSVSLETSYTVHLDRDDIIGSLFTLGANVGVDWY